MKPTQWIVAGAIAAMLAAAAPATQAQDSTSTSGASTSGSVSTDTSSGVIDYSVLANRSYDYMDLTQARASGLSDDEIASAAKIARKSGTPFRDVTAALLRGETFTMLANENGLSLEDVYDVDDEKGRIADYKRAYETTGWRAIRAMRDNGGMSGGTTGGGMSTGTSGTSNTPSTTTGNQ